MSRTIFSVTRWARPSSHLVTLALCAALWWACGGGAAETKRSEPTASSTAASYTDADIDAAAKAYMERAAVLEPILTPMLVEMAEARGGQMYKLKYRLKSEKSTRRKIHKLLTEDPALGLADIEIDDTVRYTMILEDTPPGHHDASVRAILADFESRGHSVVKVKNYWPKSDNYSGVNSVLRAADGLAWELQFHTAASVETNGSTRDMYEEMRLVDTPMARKQELFDLMSARWEEVPIPQGILTPGSLHTAEQIIDRPRPE